MKALLFFIVALLLQYSLASQNRAEVPGATHAIEEVETFELALNAHVQLGHKAGSKPAAGLVVEFGVGERGEHKRFFETPALASFTTDDKGDVHGKLTIPVRWKTDADAVLWARCASPGFMRRVISRRLSAYKPEKGWTQYASPGATLKGQALDAAGKPVVGASVWLISESMPRPFPSTSGEEGYFWIHYRDPGRPIACTLDVRFRIRLLARGRSLVWS